MGDVPDHVSWMIIILNQESLLFSPLSLMRHKDNWWLFFFQKLLTASFYPILLFFGNGKWKFVCNLCVIHYSRLTEINFIIFFSIKLTLLLSEVVDVFALTSATVNNKINLS